MSGMTDTYSAAEVAMRNSGLWVRLEDHNFAIAQYIRREAESEAARLRGDGEEGQAVFGYFYEQRLIAPEDASDWLRENGKPLYDRPQSVAGVRHGED